MNEAQPAPETPAPSAKELIKQAYAERPPTSGEEKQRELDTAVEMIREKRAAAPPHLDTPDLEIGYKQADGVSYDSAKAVSAREAGRDLAQWRERARQNVLAELGEAEAAEVAAQPAHEPQHSPKQFVPGEQAPEPQPAADPGITREGWIANVRGEIAEALQHGENPEQINSRIERQADQLIAASQSAYLKQEAALARQVQADRDAAIGAAAQYRNACAGMAQQFVDALQRELPQVRTAADVARLPPEQQERFNVLDAGYRQALGEAQQQHQNITAVQAERAAQEQQARQANLQRYKAEQEKVAERLIPELAPGADPVAQRELQQAAHAVLHGVGYTDAELRSAWADGAPISMHDGRAQAIIAKAAKYDRLMSRENELRAHRKPVPPVQRPGIGGQRVSRAEAEIQKLEAKGELSIKEATALMRAKRSARA